MIDYTKAWLGLCAEKAEDAKICILGIPFDGGASFGKGAAKAPQRIRDLAAEDMPEADDAWILAKKGILFDFGDVEIDLNWEKSFQRIEDKAYEVMKQGKFSLFIGGDHSVTIPLHRAFKKYQRERKPDGKIGIIHFDAHFDLCDQFEGHKWSHANTEKRALDDIIDPKDLLFLGIRAAESEELEIIEKHPEITVISATEVFQKGYRAAYEKIYNKFKDYDAIYFTLDIDVLDPAYAPGTGTPVFAGLSSRELLELVRLLLAHLPVQAMDIVEVAPPLDINDITSWAAIRIIQQVFSFYSK
ncbi:MAG TPA: agmatinase [Clostridiales bacterium]|nr:agmatinase [Clostridiales bacterium]